LLKTLNSILFITLVYDLKYFSLEKTKPILLFALLIAGCMLILYSCLSGHDDKMSDILDDAELLLQDQSLQRILDRDTLIALTDYNSTNYFIYRGEPMGYQFEMLQQFADFLDVNLKLVKLSLPTGLKSSPMRSGTQSTFLLIRKGRLNSLSRQLLKGRSNSQLQMSISQK